MLPVALEPVPVVEVAVIADVSTPTASLVIVTVEPLDVALYPETA
jgi:hypothetical protein